jgi:phosphonate transport system ATP-binding protein
MEPELSLPATPGARRPGARLPGARRPGARLPGARRPGARLPGAFLPGASYQLQGVAVEFGSLKALAGIDLEIHSGEAVALVGPSGAGKTTLLRLLAGSLRPSRGTLILDGRPLTALSPSELRQLRSRVGFVYQDLRLVPNLRVSKNVIAGRLGRFSLLASLRAMLFPSQDLEQQVLTLLERVGIPEKLYWRTSTLSGGQQQRVAVARALFQEPVVLLADEPVASVDPARARDTVALLTSVCRERRLTLVVSLHDLELAREFFPRLIGLRQGRVVFDRSPAELDDAAFAALYNLTPEEVLQDA